MRGFGRGGRGVQARCGRLVQARLEAGSGAVGGWFRRELLQNISGAVEGGSGARWEGDSGCSGARWEGGLGVSFSRRFQARWEEDSGAVGGGVQVGVSPKIFRRGRESA